MSNHERHGTRDLTYSRWHRVMLRRDRKMIDIDVWDEWCPECHKPVLLIETAIDIEQDWKAAYVIAQLGADTNVPTLCVLYTPTGEKCECEPQRPDPRCSHGIEKFRVRDPVTDEPFEMWTPAQLAQRIAAAHDNHRFIYHRRRS